MSRRNDPLLGHREGPIMRRLREEVNVPARRLMELRRQFFGEEPFVKHRVLMFIALMLFWAYVDSRNAYFRSVHDANIAQEMLDQGAVLENLAPYYRRRWRSLTQNGMVRPPKPPIFEEDFPVLAGFISDVMQAIRKRLLATVLMNISPVRTRVDKPIHYHQVSYVRKKATPAQIGTWVYDKDFIDAGNHADYVWSSNSTFDVQPVSSISDLPELQTQPLTTDTVLVTSNGSNWMSNLTDQYSEFRTNASNTTGLIDSPTLTLGTDLEHVAVRDGMNLLSLVSDEPYAQSVIPVNDLIHLGGLFIYDDEGRVGDIGPQAMSLYVSQGFLIFDLTWFDRYLALNGTRLAGTYWPFARHHPNLDGQLDICCPGLNCSSYIDFLNLPVGTSYDIVKMNITCQNRYNFGLLDRFIAGNWGEFASYVGFYPVKEEVYSHMSKGDVRPDDYLWDMRGWHSATHLVGCNSLNFTVESQWHVTVPLDNMYCGTESPIIYLSPVMQLGAVINQLDSEVVVASTQVFTNDHVMITRKAVPIGYNLKPYGLDDDGTRAHLLLLADHCNIRCLDLWRPGNSALQSDDGLVVTYGSSVLLSHGRIRPDYERVDSSYCQAACNRGAKSLLRLTEACIDSCPSLTVEWSALGYALGIKSHGLFTPLLTAIGRNLDDLTVILMALPVPAFYLAMVVAVMVVGRCGYNAKIFTVVIGAVGVSIIFVWTEIGIGFSDVLSQVTSCTSVFVMSVISLWLVANVHPLALELGVMAFMMVINGCSLVSGNVPTQVVGSLLISLIVISSGFITRSGTIALPGYYFLLIVVDASSNYTRLDHGSPDGICDWWVVLRALIAWLTSARGDYSIVTIIALLFNLLARSCVIGAVLAGVSSRQEVLNYLAALTTRQGTFHGMLAVLLVSTNPLSSALGAYFMSVITEEVRGGAPEAINSTVKASNPHQALDQVPVEVKHSILYGRIQHAAIRPGRHVQPDCADALSRSVAMSQPAAHISKDGKTQVFHACEVNEGTGYLILGHCLEGFGLDSKVIIGGTEYAVGKLNSPPDLRQFTPWADSIYVLTTGIQRTFSPPNTHAGVYTAFVSEPTTTAVAMRDAGPARWYTHNMGQNCRPGNSGVARCKNDDNSFFLHYGVQGDMGIGLQAKYDIVNNAELVGGMHLPDAKLDSLKRAARPQSLYSNSKLRNFWADVAPADDIHLGI